MTHARTSSRAGRHPNGCGQAAPASARDGTGPHAPTPSSRSSGKSPTATRPETLRRSPELHCGGTPDQAATSGTKAHSPNREGTLTTPRLPLPIPHDSEHWACEPKLQDMCNCCIRMIRSGPWRIPRDRRRIDHQCPRRRQLREPAIRISPPRPREFLPWRSHRVWSSRDR